MTATDPPASEPEASAADVPSDLAHQEGSGSESDAGVPAPEADAATATVSAEDPAAVETAAGSGGSPVPEVPDEERSEPPAEATERGPEGSHEAAPDATPGPTLSEGDFGPRTDPEEAADPADPEAASEGPATIEGAPSAEGAPAAAQAPEPAEPEADVEPPQDEATVSPGATAPRAPLPTPRVLAIANQKGGVGKTTTAVNLGAALTELDYRVLVIDLDPQGNATTGLGIDIRNLDTTIYDCLMADTPLEDCIEATSVRNLFVAPSNMDLAGAEIELVPMFSRELKLRRAIEGVKDDYDYVLIDCPPSLGLLTVNGLAAADDVVVPIQCEYYALEGLGQLVNNVNLVRANLNPVLDIRGIVLTMYDARTKLADQVVTEVRNHFGTRVYETVVPRTVRLSEAPSFGQPIIVFDPSSRGAGAYRDLAREVSGLGLGGSGNGSGEDRAGDSGDESAGAGE